MFSSSSGSTIFHLDVKGLQPLENVHMYEIPNSHWTSVADYCLNQERTNYGPWAITGGRLVDIRP